MYLFITTLLNYFVDPPNDNMHKKDVSELLEENGYKIVDMTEMNGLIFFYSQSVCQAIEVRANPVLRTF